MSIRPNLQFTGVPWQAAAPIDGYDVNDNVGAALDVDAPPTDQPNDFVLPERDTWTRDEMDLLAVRSVDEMPVIKADIRDLAPNTKTGEWELPSSREGLSYNISHQLETASGLAALISDLGEERFLNRHGRTVHMMLSRLGQDTSGYHLTPEQAAKLARKFVGQTITLPLSMHANVFLQFYDPEDFDEGDHLNRFNVSRGLKPHEFNPFVSVEIQIGKKIVRRSYTIQGEPLYVHGEMHHQSARKFPQVSHPGSLKFAEQPTRMSQTGLELTGYRPLITPEGKRLGETLRKLQFQQLINPDPSSTKKMIEAVDFFLGLAPVLFKPVDHVQVVSNPVLPDPANPSEFDAFIQGVMNKYLSAENVMDEAIIREPEVELRPGVKIGGRYHFEISNETGNPYLDLPTLTLAQDIDRINALAVLSGNRITYAITEAQSHGSWGHTLVVYVFDDQESVWKLYTQVDYDALGNRSFGTKEKERLQSMHWTRAYPRDQDVVRALQGVFKIAYDFYAAGLQAADADLAMDMRLVDYFKKWSEDDRKFYHGFSAKDLLEPPANRLSYAGFYYTEDLDEVIDRYQDGKATEKDFALLALRWIFVSEVGSTANLMAHMNLPPEAKSMIDELIDNAQNVAATQLTVRGHILRERLKVLSPSSQEGMLIRFDFTVPAEAEPSMPPPSKNFFPSAEETSPQEYRLGDLPRWK